MFIEDMTQPGYLGGSRTQEHGQSSVNYSTRQVSRPQDMFNEGRAQPGFLGESRPQEHGQGGRDLGEDRVDQVGSGEDGREGGLLVLWVAGY